jgi:hypothetical protein
MFYYVSVRVLTNGNFRRYKRQPTASSLQTRTIVFLLKIIRNACEDTSANGCGRFMFYYVSVRVLTNGNFRRYKRQPTASSLQTRTIVFLLTIIRNACEDKSANGCGLLIFYNVSVRVLTNGNFRRYKRQPAASSLQTRTIVFLLTIIRNACEDKSVNGLLKNKNSCQYHNEYDD